MSDNDWNSGVKFDEGKLRYDLVPIEALREITRVLTFGANKYTDRNWEKGINYGRCYAAAMRHLTAWWDGEDKDPETGISHLAHAGCCIYFLLTYEQRGMNEFDNRPFPRDDFDLDAILARVRQDYTKGAVTPRSTGPAIPIVVSERRGTIQVARGVTDSYSFTGDGRPASPSRGQVQGDATGYAQADAEGR